MRAHFLEDKLEVTDQRLRELGEMRAHLVEKIAWIRSGKPSVPDALEPRPPSESAPRSGAEER